MEIKDQYYSTAAQWTMFKAASLTPLNLQRLLNNEIPCIVVEGAASTDECLSMEAAISEVGFSDYQNVDPPIGRIGVTQFEANKTDKPWYFTRATTAYATLAEVARRSFNPLQRTIDLLTAATAPGQVTIASEPGFGAYFAGLVRRINASALIHADYAGYDAPGWSIGEINAQLAWNIYLRTPKIGGDCVVFNRTWTPEAEEFRIPSSYGYRPSLVAAVESKVIKPQIGDLVLFNSRNFHEVMLGSGDRLSVSSFVGRRPDGSLVLWS